MLLEADLPNDPDTLRAMIVEAWTEVAKRDAQIADLSIATSEADAEIARLNAIIAAFQRHRFGARRGAHRRCHERRTRQAPHLSAD